MTNLSGLFTCISGSVATIYKDQAALICGQNYPAKAINCLYAGMFSSDSCPCPLRSKRSASSGGFIALEKSEQYVQNLYRCAVKSNVIVGFQTPAFAAI